jgi:hypothetical protein
MLDALCESAAASLAQRADALCTAEDSPHEVRIGEEVHRTYCVLDALILPILANAPAVVRSSSPVSGAVVEIRIDPNRAEVTPLEAVVSYGWRLDRTGVVFDDVCPFINAFVSQNEYDTWAAATPEAATMPLSISDAVALARDLAVCSCCES